MKRPQQIRLRIFLVLGFFLGGLAVTGQTRAQWQVSDEGTHSGLDGANSKLDGLNNKQSTANDWLGFAPLFMMCLIFRSTHSLFQKWLLYGIGTMFAQALMAAMAVLCFKVVLASSAAFGAQYAIAAGMGQPQQSVSSLAMLQGGIGLLLTLLLVTVPPMAAYFFQGTLGSYMTTSVFGGATMGSGMATSRAGSQGRPAGNGSAQLPSPISQSNPQNSTNGGRGGMPPRGLPQNTDLASRDVITPYDGGRRQ